MKRNLLIAGLLGASLLFVGCAKDYEPVPERDIEGYITKVDGSIIEIGTSEGTISFETEGAKVEADNGLSLDEIVQVYFSYDGEIKNGSFFKANRVVEEVMNRLISNLSAYDAENDIAYMLVDGAEYKFDLKGIKHNPLTLDMIYEVQCESQIELSKINIASSFEQIEVDDAPSEEIELVEENTNYVEE